MKSGDYVALSNPLEDGWDQPQEVTDLDLAFPARGIELCPDWKTLPRDFRDHWDGGTDWSEFCWEWFFEGWPSRGLFSRDDVDPEMAFRHLSVIIGCYGLKHEHKMAAVAWLASRWFAAVNTDVSEDEEKAE